MNKKLKAKIIEIFGTQADFASEIKVDESLVSRIVRDRRKLSPADKIRWAKALESEPKDLFQN